MDHGVDADDLAEPEIEGSVSVAGRQVRIVIARFAVERIAAIRLDRGDEVAMRGETQGEIAITERRVVLRRAPSSGDLGARVGMQMSEQTLVVGKRKKRRGLGVAQLGDERFVAGHHIANIEAFAFQQLQYLGGALDGVETDRMGRLPSSTRIVRQHQRELSFLAWRGREPRPGRRAARRGVDALLRGRMHGARKFERGELALLGLEGDGGGQ